MAKRLYLHVGTPKAGTTYLQGLLWGNREPLAAAGLLLPGDRPFMHNLAATHVRAASAPKADAVWQQMVAEIGEHEGTAVLTNEWFSLAGVDQAEQALGELAATGCEVHVVVTARDLATLAPAAWQETLKLGNSTSLSHFIQRLERPRARWSWWTLDPAAVADRWGRTLPSERVHVVTVPRDRREPHLLWRRFASVIGVPEVEIDLSQLVPNESLSAEAARLLQLIGPRLRDAVDAEHAAWAGHRWLRRYLSHRVLAGHEGSKIGLTLAQFEVLRERAKVSARELGEAGYHVVGHLAELTTAPMDRKAVNPEEIDDGRLVDVAAAALVEVMRELRRTSNSGEPVPDVGEFDHLG